jgi:hypothetical protein
VSIHTCGPNALCRRCGSNKVGCEGKYYSTGGDMEHVEFVHTCSECRHVESDTQMACYGFDNSFWCPLPHDDGDTMAS